LSIWLGKENSLTGALSQANVDVTLEQLRSKGFEAVGSAANVSKLEDIQNIIQLAESSYGRIDVVVSNAAVNPSAGAILDTPDWAIDKLLQVNIKSAIQLLREAKPHMSRVGSTPGRADIPSRIVKFLGRTTQNVGF
jgi:NAD(P)-dependent dehydrogenase (short-subunit alcohol dehydrogenase family)